MRQFLRREERGRPGWALPFREGGESVKRRRRGGSTYRSFPVNRYLLAGRCVEDCSVIAEFTGSNTGLPVS